MHSIPESFQGWSQEAKWVENGEKTKENLLILRRLFVVMCLSYITLCFETEPHRSQAGSELGKSSKTTLNFWSSFFYLPSARLTSTPLPVFVQCWASNLRILRCQASTLPTDLHKGLTTVWSLNLSHSSLGYKEEKRSWTCLWRQKSPKLRWRLHYLRFAKSWKMRHLPETLRNGCQV